MTFAEQISIISFAVILVFCMAAYLRSHSRYENGINELPLRHLITLCGFYRVSADLILGLLESDE